MSVKSNSISLGRPRFVSGTAIGKRKLIGKSEQGIIAAESEALERG